MIMSHTAFVPGAMEPITAVTRDTGAGAAVLAAGAEDAGAATVECPDGVEPEVEEVLADEPQPQSATAAMQAVASPRTGLSADFNVTPVAECDTCH